VAIVGDHPQRGIRFILERAEEPDFPSPATPRCLYEGAAFTPDARHALRIAVDAEGNATWDDGGDGSARSVPDHIRETARLLVKTMVRHATTEGTAPPRRIMRWRAEK
jgi:hypothetical protein